MAPKAPGEYGVALIEVDDEVVQAFLGDSMDAGTGKMVAPTGEPCVPPRTAYPPGPGPPARREECTHVAMRLSTLFLRTLREDPADAELPGHKLLVRAGYIRRAAPGVYSWLPLGLKVLRKVEAVVREEMDRAGAHEMLAPPVQPAELWQETGRWDKYGRELLQRRHRMALDELVVRLQRCHRPVERHTAPKRRWGGGRGGADLSGNMLRAHVGPWCVIPDGIHNGGGAEDGNHGACFL